MEKEEIIKFLEASHWDFDFDGLLQMELSSEKGYYIGWYNAATNEFDYSVVIQNIFGFISLTTLSEIFSEYFKIKIIEADSW